MESGFDRSMEIDAFAFSFWGGTAAEKDQYDPGELPGFRRISLLVSTTTDSQEPAQIGPVSKCEMRRLIFRTLLRWRLQDATDLGRPAPAHWFFCSMYQDLHRKGKKMKAAALVSHRGLLCIMIFCLVSSPAGNVLAQDDAGETPKSRRVYVMTNRATENTLVVFQRGE